VLELKVNNFIVFAEVMADTLIKKGKTSELKQLLKNIELTKGAVKYHGSRANIHKVKEPKKTGLKSEIDSNKHRKLSWKDFTMLGVRIFLAPFPSNITLRVNYDRQK